MEYRHLCARASPHYGRFTPEHGTEPGTWGFDRDRRLMVNVQAKFDAAKFSWIGSMNQDKHLVLQRPPSALIVGAAGPRADYSIPSRRQVAGDVSRLIEQQSNRTARPLQCYADRFGCSRRPARATDAMCSRNATRHRHAAPCGRYGRASLSLGCCSSSCGKSVFTSGKRSTIRLRAGKDVVTIGRVANAGIYVPLSLARSASRACCCRYEGHQRFARQLRLEVLPRAATIRSRALTAALPSAACVKDRPPRLVTGASASRELLAVPISAFEAAEVAALAWPNADPRSDGLECYADRTGQRTCLPL